MLITAVWDEARAYLRSGSRNHAGEPFADTITGQATSIDARHRKIRGSSHTGMTMVISGSRLAVTKAALVR
jgi:hypothetical protein